MDVITMTDEKFTFLEDCREKKHTGRSYYNRFTHGGKVRLPSDNLTQKELREMSGEVKSYRLNDPMKYAEYKTMPDDLQIAYIKAIRSKYNCTNAMLAEMLGITVKTLENEITRLKLGRPKGFKAKPTDEQREAFRCWALQTMPIGEEEKVEAEPLVEPEAEKEKTFVPVAVVKAEVNTDDIADKVAEAFAKVSESTKQVGEALNNVCDKLEEAVVAEKAVEIITPVSGSLTFDGSAKQALDTIGMILKDANVRLTVTWCVAEGDV